MIKTIDLPRVAQSMPTLIGSCRIYSVFEIKRLDFESAIILALLRKTYLRDFQFIRVVRVVTGPLKGCRRRYCLKAIVRVRTIVLLFLGLGLGLKC